MHKTFLGLILSTICLYTPASYAVDGHGAAPLAWRTLACPQYLHPVDGAIYYSFTTANGSKAHLVVTNYKSGQWRFKPAINEVTQATSLTAQANSASAAVNAGFFNLSNGLSTSYLVIDGKQVADPHTNLALTQNPKLAAYLPLIFNRSEARFLKDDHDNQIIQIAPHDAPYPSDLKLLHSIQAGPQLLPELTDKQEAFVRTDPDGKTVDAINSRKGAARTAFGITPDGYAMLVCVAGTGQDPESSGISLPELRDLLKRLGCSQAINFDGGASSSMFVKLAEPTGLEPGSRTVCARNPETRVKSVLLLQANSTR